MIMNRDDFIGRSYYGTVAMQRLILEVYGKEILDSMNNVDVEKYKEKMTGLERIRKMLVEKGIYSQKPPYSICQKFMEFPFDDDDVIDEMKSVCFKNYTANKQQLANACEMIDKLNTEKEMLSNRLMSEPNKLIDKSRRLEEWAEKLEKQQAEIEAEKEKLQEAINNSLQFETAEMRDRVRLATWYENRYCEGREMNGYDMKAIQMILSGQPITDAASNSSGEQKKGRVRI